MVLIVIIHVIIMWWCSFLEVFLHINSHGAYYPQQEYTSGDYAVTHVSQWNILFGCS